MRNLTFIFLIVTTLANANTSYFRTTPELSLDAHEVNISPDKVVAIYTFTNNSNKDIVQNFIFPLQDNGYESTKNFTVEVNDKCIEYKTMQRAISFTGIDITEHLNKLNLPLLPTKAMHSIDHSKNREIIIESLLGKKLLDRRDERPLWFVQGMHYWLQTFPAKSTVVIKETYSPPLKSKIIHVASPEGIIKTPWKYMKRAAKLAIRWNLDNDHAATHLQEQIEKYYPEIAQYCPTLEDYRILSLNTDAHEIKFQQLQYVSIDPGLAPAIKNYNLQINVPDDMHAFVCWNDALRDDGKSLYFSAKNFVPLHDLRVLYAK